MRLTRARQCLTSVACALALAACEPAEEPGHYTGYVEAELRYIAAPQSGWIIDMLVQEGDNVPADASLFHLDTDYETAALNEAAERWAQANAQALDLDTGARAEEIAALEAQLKEAQATLQFARAERARWIELAERNVAPEARRDEVIAAEEEAEARVERLSREIDVANLPGRQAEREAAQAQMHVMAAARKQAEWQLDQRRVRAREAGKVEEIFFRRGEYVTSGSPVLALLPDDALKVRFFVPERELSDLAIGDRVRVTTDTSPAPLEAEISFIAREAEFTPPVIYSVETRDKLVFLVEARLADPHMLRPGQPADVHLQ